jgi:hypothetical protein
MSTCRFRFSFFCLLLWPGISASVAQEKPRKEQAGVVFASIDRQFLYTCLSDPAAPDRAELVRCRVTDNKMRVQSLSPEVSSARDLPPRWRIKHRALVFVGGDKSDRGSGPTPRVLKVHRYHLDDLDAEGNPVPMPRHFRFGTEEPILDLLHGLCQANEMPNTGKPPLFWYDVEANGNNSYGIYLLAPYALEENIEYFGIPGEYRPTRYRGAILKDRPDPLLSVWRYNNYRKPSEGWKGMIDEVKPLFQEPFWAFVEAEGHQHCFVTASGKIYTAQRVEGDRKMTVTWSEKDRPIVAIIEDPDNAKVYLFGKSLKDTGRDAKDFYIELDARARRSPLKIELRFFPRQALWPVEGQRPLTTLIAYARLLVAEGKLTLKN